MSGQQAVDEAWELVEKRRLLQTAVRGATPQELINILNSTLQKDPETYRLLVLEVIAQEAAEIPPSLQNLMVRMEPSIASELSHRDDVTVDVLVEGVVAGVKMFINDSPRFSLIQLLRHPKLPLWLLREMHEMEELFMAFHSRYSLRSILTKNPNLPLPIRASITLDTRPTEILNLQASDLVSHGWVDAKDKTGSRLREKRQVQILTEYPELVGFPIDLTLDLLATQPVPADSPWWEPVPEKWEELLDRTRQIWEARAREGSI